MNFAIERRKHGDTCAARTPGLRQLAACLFVLIFVASALLLPLRAGAVDWDSETEKLAPYAEAGDMDYIPEYLVTVDLRADGSADITYDITWQVIGGDKTDYLSWVKIGLPNAYAEDLTPLTDTIADVQYSDEGGGSYAKVVFARRYYSPEVAAENGGESRVRFAFSVHQSHLFTRSDDGTASFEFTPGWFDDLVVEHMQVRWRSGDGFVADNTGTENDYLTWGFGPMIHGESADVHVTVPVTTADGFDPDAALTAADYDNGDDLSGLANILVVLGVLLLIIAVALIFVSARSPEWDGGFGDGLDPDDWYWYTNGTHVIHVARTAPPPAGYHRTDPPKNYHTGGGHSRGGGVGRHGGGGGPSCACVSSCACACASSCACACACAGGGRAGCTAKDFYTYKLPKKADREDDQ